jgi:hypothetical protein
MNEALEVVMDHADDIEFLREIARNPAIFARILAIAPIGDEAFTRAVASRMVDDQTRQLGRWLLDMHPTEAPVE